jgi:hypothetical protein
VRWLCCIALAACGRVGFDPRDAPDAAVPPDPRLRLHLPFDGAGPALIADRFGHATDCAGCPMPTMARDGTQAATFDGTACVRVADAADLRAEVFTYAVWWRTTTAAQDTTVFSRPEASETNVTNTFELFLFQDGLEILVHRVSVRQPIPLDAWHHVAATFDGMTYRAYLDGALLDERAATPFAVTANDLKIGCDRDLAIDRGFFIGDIDDARFYDAVLDDTEIAGLAR